MPILDAQTLFSDDQAVTTTAASTNYYDWGAPGTAHGAAAARARDLGKSEIPIFCRVSNADFAGGTSIKVAVQGDNDVAFGSAVTLFETEAIPTATLVKGYDFAIGNVPRHATERYMRLNYTVVGTMTAGNITAGLGTPSDTNT